MTLGEKIRYARKYCALSQEQLADKMCVSRSAIAKWETEKGMPDIENLKILSRLLHVSIDFLLDDSNKPFNPMIREPYSIASCGRGCKKVRKDRLMAEKFPNARILTLLGRPNLAEDSLITDKTGGVLMPIPFGNPEFMKSLRDLDRSFYLVEQDDLLLFVTVTDTHIEISPCLQKPNEKAFQLGNWTFIQCGDL